MMKQKTIAYGIACMISASFAYAAVDKTAVPVRPGAKPPSVQKNVEAPISVRLPALSAEQIIERNVAARGGLAAWKRVKSITLVGKMDAGKTRRDGGYIAAQTSPLNKAVAKAELRASLSGNGEAATDKVIQLPFQMEMKRPMMQRLEIPFNGQTSVQVYDGVHGWKLRPYLGRHEVEPFTREELKIAAAQQELDGPLIDYAAKGTRAAVDGTERVDGHDAYRLKLTLKNGDVRHVWIDAQSFLDIKTEGAPRQWDGKSRPVMTYYRDFRTVDGLKIPHALETTIDGVRSAENIQVERVAVNADLDDSRFKKPL